MTRITEVLTEPGSLQVWVSLDDGQTHRVDLTGLLDLDAFQALRLPRVQMGVRIAPDAWHLRWPGGAQLDVTSITEAPAGPLPVRPVAVLPAEQRYRPLLPYLRALEPVIYLHPNPVAERVVCDLLGLKAADLQTMLRHYPAPTEVTLNRMYDLGAFLNDLFPRQHMHALLRRDWPYAIRSCPGQGLLHTMLGCLSYGRPDLIERPCLLLASGVV